MDSANPLSPAAVAALRLRRAAGVPWLPARRIPVSRHTPRCAVLPKSPLFRWNSRITACKAFQWVHENPSWARPLRYYYYAQVSSYADELHRLQHCGRLTNGCPPRADAVVRAVVEINSDTAHRAGFHPQAIRWEADTIPGFHDLGPQGLIDEVLEIESADPLIGIFWHRLGTPTTDGMRRAEHEFRKAYLSWQSTRRPEIMVYFNEQSVPIKLVAPEQLARLLEFKKSFPTEGMWWPYHGKVNFAKLINAHLRKFLGPRISPKPIPLISWKAGGEAECQIRTRERERESLV